MPASHMRSHVTHPGLTSPFCPPHLSNLVPGLNIPVCSLAVPGLAALNLIACPWEGTAWCSHQLTRLSPTDLVEWLCVLRLYHAPMGQCTGLGRLGMFVNSRVGRWPPGH